MPVYMSLDLMSKEDFLNNFIFVLIFRTLKLSIPVPYFEIQDIRSFLVICTFIKSD